MTTPGRANLAAVLRRVTESGTAIQGATRSVSPTPAATGWN
ncbi:hypothetical protein [Deinococcus sp.]